MLEEIQKLSDSDVFSITLPNESEKFRYWFRATDLCNILFSKANSHKYVTLHCKDWQYREFQAGMGRPALYVCESGVYRLIMRSKAPIAVELQDWLTEEVLPKLRASGVYISASATSEAIEAAVAEHKKVIAHLEATVIETRKELVAVKTGSHSLDEFIRRYLDISPDSRGAEHSWGVEVYEVYKHYCKSEGKRPIRFDDFIQTLKQRLGSEHWDASSRHWLGVTIQSQFKQIGYSAKGR